jgi:molybdate transport system regulatory protein
MPRSLQVKGLVWLSSGERNFGGPGRIALLEAIRTEGSITGAARRVGLSYKAAWDAVDTMNNLAGEPLVQRTTGGKGGGSTRLTPRGERLIENFHLIEAEHQRFLDLLSTYARGMPDEIHLLRRLNLMKTSARNQFVGKVTAVKHGAVNDEVELEIAGGQRIVAVVTHASTENLGLKAGREAFALVKASSVILMTDAGKVKLSARNRLAGKVSRVEPGAVNTEVVVDLPGGGAVAAIVTVQSAQNLGLKVGDPVTAVFKASSVILGAQE